MATQDELREALKDYVARAKANERVQKMLQTWNCVILIQATDVDATFTLVLRDGQVTGPLDGPQGQADLIVSGSSEDLANIFWGDENPASNYMQGAIKTQGSQEDTMRLDAMAMFIYLGK